MVHSSNCSTGISFYSRSTFNDLLLMVVLILFCTIMPQRSCYGEIVRTNVDDTNPMTIEDETTTTTNVPPTKTTTIATSSSSSTTSQCERLKTSLTYSQEDAPSDLSGVIPVVVERINRELDGVVDVEVEWKGSDLHQGGYVGEHIIQCKVTRLASVMQKNSRMMNKSRNDEINDLPQTFVDDDGHVVMTQCYHIPFTITDTNECTLPRHHPMVHQCDASTICVNTIGSYECVCPRIYPSKYDTVIEHGQTIDLENEILFFQQQIGTTVHRTLWELSYPTDKYKKCSNVPSTYGCCELENDTMDGTRTGTTTTKTTTTTMMMKTEQLALCRSLFQCPVDPCHNDDARKNTIHDCTSLATCVRNPEPSYDTRRITTTTTNTGTTSTIQSSSSSKPSQQHRNIKNYEPIYDYTCQCPTGYFGNGHQCTNNDSIPQPKVMYDGITPTEETIRNQYYYCGCTVPIIDPCAGFPTCTGKHQECSVDNATKEPKCTCKKGYMYHDTYGCVDEEPPVLRLIHDPNLDQTLHLKQGDSYKEYAVEIQDENAEEYLRSLKIAYSQPLPPKCFIKMGTFHVNYTIATPWTIPPYVRITRRVIIDDINECTLNQQQYATQCPALVPQCDEHAQCMNTKGSYKCQCPKYTTGDGYRIGVTWSDEQMIPEGFKGGMGCIDTTPPIIQLTGPNPKIFKVAECTGITGIIMNHSPKNISATAITTTTPRTLLLQDKSTLKHTQQEYFAHDIKALIQQSKGAELCATHVRTNPTPTDCVTAYDMTAQGRVDLSYQVMIGEPIQKSNLLWSVPYDVKDAAGNAAETVWRDVQVEEVNIIDMEKKIRNEVISQYKNEMNHLIEKVKDEERRKYEKTNSTITTRNMNCPACPKCSLDGEEIGSCPVSYVSEASCASICQKKIKSCAIDEKSWVIRFLLYSEKYLGHSTIVPTLLLCVLATFTFLLLRAILTWIFNPAASYSTRNSYENYVQQEAEREKRLLESVTYYNFGSNGSSSKNPPPDSFGTGMVGGTNNMSRSNDMNGSVFSSPYSNGGGGGSGSGVYGNNLTTPRNTDNNSNGGFVPPPRASMSLGTDMNFFTPSNVTYSGSRHSPEFGFTSGGRGIGEGGTNNIYQQQQQQQQQQLHADFRDPNNIYDTTTISPTTIITPSKRGDGVGRRIIPTPHRS